MADYGGDGIGGCCQWCTRLLLSLGFLSLFMWLSLRASKPTCSIQEFYLPALNKSANSTANTTVFFHLTLDNRNKDKGVHYDALNLTFYYGPNRSRPIGDATFPAFYQGHKKKAHRMELVGTRPGVPWGEAIRAASNGTAVFRVELATAVRFKIVFWNTRRYKVLVGSTVEVNDSGRKKNKKGIKLKSGAPEHNRYCAPKAQSLFVVLSTLIVMFL